MNSAIVGMFAETSIHPGSGQDTGFVDLPVAREKTTGYPVIVGSSLKGALREKARREGWDQPDEEADDADDSKIGDVFGIQANAGRLVVSDARLLMLPVRSLNQQYMWVTCPHLIERYKRDRKRASLDETELPDQHLARLDQPAGDIPPAIAPSQETIFLEERQFQGILPLDETNLSGLKELIDSDQAANRVSDQLVILPDDEFAWFARFGLEVNARNTLDNDTKQSEHLWYEETIPADSLFYTVLGDRTGGNGADSLDEMKGLFGDSAYLRVGGNETVGQGWFATTWHTAD